MAATLSSFPPPSETEAATALAGVRGRTLALVGELSDEDLDRVHDPIMSPLVWDLGHIAAYEDLWLAHRLCGLELLRPDLMSAYDAFETPRPERGGIELLSRAEAEAYLDEVRARVLAAFDPQAPDAALLLEMVARHEATHNETMLQTLGLARLDHHRGIDPAPAPRAAASPPARPPSGLELLDVAGARFELGAVGEGFAYDNERPAHGVDVEPFRIGRTPVTNGDWLEWIRAGGYGRREWWTDAGWAWRAGLAKPHPGGWIADGPPGDPGTDVREWRVGGAIALDLHAPVIHVSHHEALAFARAHGLRLPTEAEWELAATWDHAQARKLPAPWDGDPSSEGRANLLEAGAWGTVAAGSLPRGASPCGALGMLGDVWEWTATAFVGYPGFVAHPYREYSEVFFGGRYRVLRGGSWAASARVATATYRNWDLPERRQIFAGLRLAGDAR